MPAAEALQDQPTLVARSSGSLHDVQLKESGAATSLFDVQGGQLRAQLLQRHTWQQQQTSMLTGSELVQALVRKSSREDEASFSFVDGYESVRDLRKAIVKNHNEGSTVVRRAHTPPARRKTEDLLDPSIGYMSDVAQPGGFRRFHIHGENSKAHQSLLQLILLPDCRSVSFADVFSDAHTENCDPFEGPIAPKNHSSSNLATVIMVSKCCFTACFLFVPNGFKLAGMIGGPLCLGVVWLFMMWGIYCLIESRKVNGSGRYQDLALVWGKKGQQLLHWVITAICFGSNCVWASGIAANLGMLVPTWSVNARLFFFFPLVAMLSLVRHLRFFTGTNILGLVISVATFCYILSYSILEIADRGAKPVFLATSGFNFLLWLGECGYAFEIIGVVLPVYEAAADKESVFSVIFLVSGSLIILYVALGYAVYLAFGDETQPIALLNLPQGTAAGYIFPGLYALSGATTMPLNTFVISLSYEPLFTWPSHTLKRKWLKNFGRIALVALIYATTWFGGGQLQNFLGLVGGVLGMFLALVAPCLLHLALCKPAGWARILDLSTVTVGVFIMGTSFYLWLTNWEGS